MSGDKHYCACDHTYTKKDGSVWQCACQVPVQESGTKCHNCKTGSHVSRKVS